eukprot:m.281882 g.281882  ORF g.281882 m.281882 type:complete len:691 (+) comp16181_c0_seq1:2882-4954(+)
MDTDGHPAEAVFASGAPSHFHNSAYRPSDGPQLPEGGGQGEVAMGRVNSDDNAMDEDPQARRGPPPTERLTFASLHNASSQQERPPRRMSSDYSLEDDKLEEGEEEDGGQRGDEGEDPEAAAVDHAAAAAPHPSSLHHSPSSVARMRGMSEGIARARYVRAAVQAADSDRPWPSPEKMDDEIEQQRIQARRDRNRKFQAKKRKMHKEIVETLTAEAARYEAENARLGREIVTLERKIEALRSGAAKGGAAEALMRVAETRHMMGGSTSLPPTDAEVAAAIAARGHSQMREAGLTRVQEMIRNRDRATDNKRAKASETQQPVADIRPTICMMSPETPMLLRGAPLHSSEIASADFEVAMKILTGISSVADTPHTFAQPALVTQSTAHRSPYFLNEKNPWTNRPAAPTHHCRRSPAQTLNWTVPLTEASGVGGLDLTKFASPELATAVLATLQAAGLVDHFGNVHTSATRAKIAKVLRIELAKTTIGKDYMANDCAIVNAVLRARYNHLNLLNINTETFQIKSQRGVDAFNLRTDSGSAIADDYGIEPTSAHISKLSEDGMLGQHRSSVFFRPRAHHKDLSLSKRSLLLLGLLVPGPAGAISTGSGCVNENDFPLTWEAAVSSAAVALLTLVVLVMTALLLHRYGNVRRVEFLGTAVEFFDPPVAPERTDQGQRRRNNPRKTFRDCQDSEIN